MITLIGIIGVVAVLAAGVSLLLNHDRREQRIVDSDSLDRARLTAGNDR